MTHSGRARPPMSHSRPRSGLSGLAGASSATDPPAWGPLDRFPRRVGLVSTVILLRHGKSTANGSGVLAGRSPKVNLDDTGRAQAEKLVERLEGVPLAELVVSPMLRCKQTVGPLAAPRGRAKLVEPGLSEVDYGDWTGKELKHLAKERLWRLVQAHASAALFPGG